MPLVLPPLHVKHKPFTCTRVFLVDDISSDDTLVTIYIKFLLLVELKEETNPDKEIFVQTTTDIYIKVSMIPYWIEMSAIPVIW